MAPSPWPSPPDAGARGSDGIVPKCVKCDRVFHATQLIEGWCGGCQSKKVAAIESETTAALELITEQLAAILAELKILNGLIREKVS